MNYRILCLCCCLWSAYTACRLPSPAAPPAAASPRFFDLSAFFQSEISRLHLTPPRILKTVAIDQQSAQDTLPAPDWQTELAFFMQSDINKPVLWDKYKVDSLFTDDKQLLEIRYEALRPELRTRKLDVQFKDNKVHTILIVNHLDNSIYNTKEFLSYIPAQGYRVTKAQTVWGATETNYDIRTSFLPL